MADETWVVSMPKLGETVTEGTINAWLKSVGDTVEFDDPLFEVSTDKVDSEIPSPYDGVILEIMVPAGETVPIDTPLVRIGAPGAQPSATPAPTAAPAEVPAAAAEQQPGEPVTAEGAGVVHDITMPKLGETVTEGTVGSWLKNVGDTIEFDDPLFEVSTDKVDSEIPSPYDGVLLEILVGADETVPVGTVVARIGEPGAAPSGTGAVAPAAPASGPAAQQVSVSAEVSATPPAVPGKTYSPLVRRLAAEHNIDLATVTGTGVGGRIRREDVQAVIAHGPATAAPVTAAAPARTAAPAAAPAAPAAVPGVSDPRDRVEPLTRMRLAIAAGMVQSLQISPHVWTSVEVDYENVEIARRKHKDAFRAEAGTSLSYLLFAAKAAAEALGKFPAINSSVDLEAKTQTFHPYVNLGVAVDLDEQGLMVPVIKDVDQLNIKGIGIQLKAKADGARAGKLGPDEYKGSTFTITSVGTLGSYASAPIINQPNVAILSVDGVSRKPVAVGDTLAIHSVGIVGLVYDHRALDGATASKFLAEVRNIIENRDWVAEVSGVVSGQ